MPSHEQIIQHWVTRVTAGESGWQVLNKSSKQNIITETNRIYSYGSHFEMARWLPEQKMFLVNGDTYSVSTSRHQSILRTALRGHASIIIPHSVLRSADVMIDSIVPVDVLNDRTITVHHEANTEPKYARDEWLDAEGVWHWTTERHVMGESLVKARTDPRAVTLLSGFDDQDGTYFLCELPSDFTGTTVKQAYEALKPALVHHAEAQGRQVRRQGDVFAVAVPEVTRTELRRRGFTYARMVNILNTNHLATEVMTDGNATYVRGILWHRPEGRPSDHRRIVLGKQFHLLAKNTVPVVAG